MFRGAKIQKENETGKQNGRKLRIFLNFLPFSFAYSINSCIFAITIKL